MKKNWSLFLLLALVLVLSLSSVAAAETIFTDVAQDAWYYGDVQAAQDLGLMEGVGGGRFAPDSSLTLAEAVTLATRARSLYLKDGEPFTRYDEWYRVYVDYAIANGILKEEPTDWTIPATRTVCAALFAAAMPDDGLKSINTISDGAIPDVPSDAAVYTLYRAGVMVGDDAHRFHPNDPIRRCEIAAVVNRLLQPESRLSVTLTEPAESHGSSPSGGHHEWEPVTEPVVDPTTEPSDDTTNSDGEVTVPYDLSHPEEFASGDVLYEDGSMLVKFKTPFAGTVSGPLKDAGVAKLDKLMDLEGAVWYTAYLSAGTDVHEAVDAVRAMDNVILAEYNFVYTAEAVVADDGPISEAVLDNAQINDQWYINSVGIQSAWQFQRGSLSENFKPHMQNENPPEEGQPEEPEQPGTAETLSGGSSDVVVAVIDTGVDYTHEDLRTNMWHNPGEIADNGIDDDGNGYVDDYFGIDIVAGHGSGNDDHGHGTHVAGIIAAVNNDRGVVGVAYNTRIMSVKAGQSSGFFTQSAIAAAVIYAANNGADVINMSFGGPSITVAVQDALAYAYTRCVLVAATGNDGVGNNVPPCNPEHYTDQPTYPAALTYVLGVMSVDRSGGLSGFSNFDCIPFDNYEYEVYAPGEAMLSTIPGDRYASWNGTSMAAPMVSGVAALLRSEFTDRNTYPTKFIYGQLSGTGPLGPDGYHRIVNAYDALTILPQPDVETTEYRLFDTPGFALDTAGKNTGDGVIDAGETVAIGFFLRNHWGMAKNVKVSVDALSPSGIPCPYLEILTESVNYGTVGTYSTQDAGQVMTDGVFTAWENPIYLHITDDCPNDYIIALNVHVTAENALDPDDDTIYQSDKVYYLEVRRGTVLPQIISSDMTLTKDDLYIIPNATTIQSGVTVTVEPGTRIQFWTDDPHDPYADQYMASLIVKGTLLVNGTAEEPVEMFPSELMSRYNVMIDTQGRTELRYAKVTNPFFGRMQGNNRLVSAVTYAEGCEFTQNYSDGVGLIRWLSGGQVVTGYYSSGGRMRIADANNCVFYKMNYYTETDFPNIKIDRAYGCAFIDSCFKVEGIVSAEDCLFYGNNLSWNNNQSGAASSYTLGVGWHEYYYYVDGLTSLLLERQLQDPETGKHYLVVRNNNSQRPVFASTMERFAEYMGGTLACPETQHEREFLQDNGISGVIGLRNDPATSTANWVNGHSFNEENWMVFYPGEYGYEGQQYLILDNYYTLNTDGGLSLYYYDYSYIWDLGSGIFIIELPGTSLIETISLPDIQVSMVMEDSYVIKPVINPSAAKQDLLFFSGCEDIVTVSEDGVITPVGPGSTRVYVYSADMCVNASLEVTVESDESTNPLNEVVDFIETGDIVLPTATERDTDEFTEEEFNAYLAEFIGEGLSTRFWHNAIINRLTDDDVSNWLRFIAPEEDEISYPFGGNYWGTTNPTLIGLQILDYRDFTTLGLINEGEYLTEAPEAVWPFATRAGVLVDGEETAIIGNEAVTFYVEFNRDMDQSIPLRVCFGSSYPYADYEIDGQWVSARRWEGATTLTTLIEGGYNYFSISNGASIDGKKLYTDWGRFRFEIDNSSALALIMQGSADANGVTLTWTQDDFDTLMGYNVYRSDALNGQYTRLNRTVIPADTKTFFDPNVEPGVEYFYNFTVVKTDATESEPSGRISVTTYDSMAPTLTHSPVYQAFAGNSVTISANVTDNVGVQNVKLYYRVTGESGWRTAEMNHLNDKYTAVITANYVTTAGLEYYIDAFDGISHTLRGSAAEPFIIAVQNTVADSDKGDVNGNGRIDMLDALLLLQSINGRVNLSAEEFARADINGDGELSAFEAMRILQYLNGKISTVLFD